MRSQLERIKSSLENGEEVNPVTVREFVSWHSGAQRRGWYVVESIERILNELGLETVPDFNSAYIDTHIQFRLKSNPDLIEETANVEPGYNDNIEHDEEGLLSLDDPTYRISRLEAANKDLVYVKPDSDLSEAITLMITHDFSQLPVMQSAKRNIKGMISWRSIGSKLSVGVESRRVADLMDKNYQLIPSDTSLFKALPVIIEHDYVLVKNNINEICGIITAIDLSLQFKQLTEPFLLVAEIENHIRQILGRLDLSDLQNAKNEADENREINSVADLTFGEYVRLFQDPQIWDKLLRTYDRTIFCKLLDTIREVRNNIMHFDPDGLDANSIESLREFVRLLQSIKIHNLY